MREIGKVFAEKFKDTGITKVVTIETSGIAPALYATEALDVPMIFAKKAKNITMNEGIPTAEVYSFTKQVTSTVEAVGIVIEKSFQDGRALLEEAGYPIVSLARLERFENGQVVFKEADI